MFNIRNFMMTGLLSLTLINPVSAATVQDAAEAIKNQEFEKASRLLLDVAGKGDRDAQFLLAMMYEHGRGVAKSDEEAFMWYKQAAQQGHDAAQNNLGQMYKQGQGVKQDFKEAAKWFRKAALQDNPVAQYNLGVRYTKGEGVEKDLAEGVKWYRKSAEIGNMFAQFALAYAYATGEGVEKNMVEAYAWAKASSTKKLLRAQQFVGFLGSKLSPDELAKGDQRFLELKEKLGLADAPPPAGPVTPQPPVVPAGVKPAQPDDSAS